MYFLKRFLLLAPLCLLMVLCVRAQPVEIIPVPVKEGALSLNGIWDFKYIAGLDAGADEAFYTQGFEASAWRPIVVPGHWELQGFAEPHYDSDVQEGLGLYRRNFRTDKAWAGRRVILRFEGVLFGFKVYVNGREVGEWASAFNPSSFDITEALAPAGAENVLAVRVTTRSRGWDFDTMDCWGISGIYRDVSVFSVPETHLKDYTVRSTLLPDGTARLDIAAVASGKGVLSGRLSAPGGDPAGGFETALGADGSAAASITVTKPALWTAETPSLYRLELSLRSPDGSLQQLRTRVGLRQVTIEDGILKLNGTPIKLHGVDHHEMWPEGRVSTDENTRRDLERMLKANINFVRTSHYPPHPRLLELCDELGIYVLDEVPYTHGRQHLTDPSYQDVLYTRARATVLRDKNHPCILFWSLGNENPINELGVNALRRVKELDPTRPAMFPTIGSYFAENWQRMTELQEIYAAHYPNPKRAHEHAETLRKPILFTEYAHQRGLSRSGTAVQDLWELFYASPRIAGGAIWMFQDQGILRQADDTSKVNEADLKVWLDEHRYYDTNGFYGMDGLVYSDRTPQIDYWLVRRVYAPVQIRAASLLVRAGAQALPLSVENRHDFLTLAGFRLQWALLRNGSVLQKGSLPLGAKPKETETLSVQMTLPEQPGLDVFTLELRCENPRGVPIQDCAFQLHPESARPDTRREELLASLPATETTLEVSELAIKVGRPDYRLLLDRGTGQVTLQRADGTVLVSAFGPHTGRHPTINDLGRKYERAAQLWAGSLLDEVLGLSTEARRLPEGVELVVSGQYPRPGKSEESVRGSYRLLVTPSGAIEVSYRYVPEKASGLLLEAGFALAVPPVQSEFLWLGQGPYAGYPGKDRHNDYGLFHLNREDLHFPGNRRGVELAALCQQSGPGLLLLGEGMTVDLENKAGRTLLSHVSAVPGDQSSAAARADYVDISAHLKAENLGEIAGHFTLLPLTQTWPKPLDHWFEAVRGPVNPFKPFLHSYDQ